MKFAIVGSRTFKDYFLLKERLSKFKISEIISGGADGADFLAERYAEEYSIKLTVFPADWEKFGKRAGYVRNIQIVDKCDLVYAFWDGKSKGTKHSIDYARKIDKEVLIEKFN